MITKTKRILLFIFGCLIIRIGLVFLAKNISEQNLSYMGYMALIPTWVFYNIFR